MENTAIAAPQIIVIGGPNGAGKSTIATRLIPPTIEFINVDEIAKTPAETVTGSVNVQAGRLMFLQEEIGNDRRIAAKARFDSSRF